MKVSVKIDRESNNLTGVSADIRKKMQQVIAYGINATRNTAVDNILRGAKSGETYVKYNPRRTHQATASGQFPASDTGFLVSKITMNVREKTDGSVVGQIISAAPYSAHLEYGTTNMTERPFMQPALEKNRRKIHSMFKKGVLK